MTMTTMVDIISGSTASATGLRCTIHGGSGQTPCSATASVSISSANSTHIEAVGNGFHAGS
jgi:hypothetical protein